MQPSPSLNRGKAFRRMRRILAFIGLLLIIGSIILLMSVYDTPQREQLRYNPPATLFAPPEVEP